MSPHGTPDWGQAKATTVHSIIDDLAELAARLGSIDTFDRRGNIIIMDNFSQGRAQWADALYGTGAAASLTAERCKSPPFSLALTTGNDGGCGVKATRKFAYPVLSKFGIEYSFTHLVNLVSYMLLFYVRDGTTAEHYIVYYGIQDGIIYVREPGPAWTEAYTGLKFKTDAWTFRTHKLVVDPVNNAYVRLILDGVKYDLSDYEPYSEADTSHPYLEAGVQFTGDVGSNRTLYVDNFIATQNE